MPAAPAERWPDYDSSKEGFPTLGKAACTGNLPLIFFIKNRLDHLFDIA